MTNPTTDVNAWRQEGLFPAEHVRIVCEAIVSFGGNQNTFSVRCVDASDDTLIAAWTLPLRGPETLDVDLAAAFDELQDLAYHHARPF